MEQVARATPEQAIVPPLPGPFTRLAWSNLVAQSAEQIGLAAAPMVAVLSLGAGAGATGLLAAAQSLPFLLLSLPAGVLADRFSRRQLMVGAEAARTGALLIVPALMALRVLSVPLLALLGFAAATGTVVFSVAVPSIVPSLVPRGALAAANSRLELARSGAFAAGPAIAGALVGWAGATPAFALAVALSAGAVLLLGGMPEPARAGGPARDIRNDVRDDLWQGAGFALSNSLLRPILLTAVAWNLAWFVLQAAYVPYAVRTMHLSAAGVGGTLACYGTGMLAGAFLAPRVTRTASFGTAIVIGPAASLVAAAAMTATILAPSAGLAGASFFLFGAGPVVWTVTQMTLRQTITPERLLGRVSAVFMTATTGARPVGAAIGAALGAAFGPAVCIEAAGLGFLLQLLIIARSPAARLAQSPRPEAV